MSVPTCNWVGFIEMWETPQCSPGKHSWQYGRHVLCCSPALHLKPHLLNDYILHYIPVIIAGQEKESRTETETDPCNFNPSPSGASWPDNFRCSPISLIDLFAIMRSSHPLCPSIPGSFSYPLRSHSACPGLFRILLSSVNGGLGKKLISDVGIVSPGAPGSAVV